MKSLQELVADIDRVMQATGDPELWSMWGRLRREAHPERLARLSVHERASLAREFREFARRLRAEAHADRRLRTEHEVERLRCVTA